MDIRCSRESNPHLSTFVGTLHGLPRGVPPPAAWRRKVSKEILPPVLPFLLTLFFFLGSWFLKRTVASDVFFPQYLPPPWRQAFFLSRQSPLLKAVCPLTITGDPCAAALIPCFSWFTLPFFVIPPFLQVVEGSGIPSLSALMLKLRPTSPASSTWSPFPSCLRWFHTI